MMMMIVLMTMIDQGYNKEEVTPVMRMTTMMIQMECHYYRKGQEKTAVVITMMVHQTNQNHHQ